jgi:hypothetical protein
MGGCEVLSANATTPYHQPKTCVELNVGHVITCTWHWISVGYHEPIFECAYPLKKIGFSILPHLEHGRTLPVKMQWVELHQWGQWLEPQAHLKRVVANRNM